MNNDSRTFGGLGALFIALSFLPYVGTLLSLAGIILVFVSVKKLAEEFGEREFTSIFIKGILISIIGSILGGAIFSAGFVPLASGGGSGIFGIALIGLGLIIIWVANIFGMRFLKDLFIKIGELTNNDLFVWAGKLFYWGALALIVLVGGIVIWAGWVVLSIAYFTTPVKAQIDS
ncbi:MAG: DUF996 domain-containing protein [Desulfurobacteriaceae bacterium]